MTENTPHANVKQVLHGLAIPVVLPIINTPAPEPDIREALAQLAAGNILNAPAPADILGAMENVKNNLPQVQAVVHLPVVDLLAVFHVVIIWDMDVYVLMTQTELVFVVV